MTIGSIRIDRRSLVAAFLLTALYGVIGLCVLDPESLFSIDAGIKYIQAQALHDSGFTSTALPYPAQTLDPERRSLPFGPPFVLERDGRLQGIFPLLGTFLYGAVLPGGLAAMVLVSVAAACAVMLTIGTMRRAHAAGAIVVLGTCTWFWAYGVLLWEHMPALAFSTAAWALLSNDDRPRPLLAGALLGLACCLRPESILLTPGLALITGAAGGWRSAARFAAGVVGPMAAVAAVDALVYHRAPWVHVMHAVDLVWRGASGSAEIARPAQASWLEQLTVVFGHWLVGLPGLPAAMAVIGVLVVANLRATSLHVAAVLAVLVGSAALVGRDVAAAFSEPGPVAGLIRGAPFLVFAFLPLATGTPGRRRLCEQATVVIFILGLLWTTEYGGAQIGPRLLTPLLPMLAVLSVEGFATYRVASATDASASLVRGLGVVLLVGSMAIQVVANFASLRAVNREGTEVLRFIRASGAVVTVLTDRHLFNHIAPEYATQLVVRASADGDTTPLLARLSKAGAQTVLTLRRPADRPVELPGYQVDGAVNAPHVAVTRWVRTP